MYSIEERIIKRKRNFLQVLKYTSIMIFSFLSFRSIIFEPYLIPSGSMIPTLHIGDFILVKKYEYGLKIPFSDIALFDYNFKPIYITKQIEPKRGDVIVFKYPKDPSINYIKRVIGLPGDVIEIKEKNVYINNTLMTANKIKRTSKDRFQSVEIKLKNKKFIIQQDVDNIYTSYLDKVKIPKGKVFVMGDNRDFSSDSREWGFVPLESIRGKAVLVWFSMTTGKDGLEVKSKRILQNIN